MDEKRPSSPPPRDEKRPGPPSGNVIWVLLIVVGVALVIATILRQQHGHVTISFADFIRLIQQVDEDTPQAEASITVQRGTDENKKDVVYSAPDDLVVGPEEITGTVEEKVERPADASGDPAAEPRRVRFTTARRGVDFDGAYLTKELTERNIDFSAEGSPGFWQQHGVLLLTTALLILVFFFFLRRLGGAGSPMAFGRSRGKLWAQEDIGIMFDDVAGIDEAVEELREVVEFLRQPEKYQRLGGRIPKGVLLVGPPGTGKTLLAKAIAGEASVPFFSLSGSDFVEMFVGVGAARVRDMFQQSENKAPCIIFIDELDALGKTRGSSVVGGHDEREQTLNALLVEMDGFTSNSGVVVIGATNRPETLDPALLRPGRFDRHVLVDRPDVRGREAILKVHVQKVKLGETVDLKKVAELTSGFVGADLANLVNEAALLAARKDKSAVEMDEFNEGIERVTAGLEKKQRIMHADEKQRVAVHESGHALAAYTLPEADPVHKVSIIPRGLGALGYVLQRPEGDRYLMTQRELECRIQVLLAGTVAEELVFEDVSTGAQNDLERASEITRSMVMEFGMSRMGRVNYRESNRSPFLASGGEAPPIHTHSEQTAREIDEEVQRIIGGQLDKVRHLLATRRDTLDELSKRLLEKETIEADELKEIIERTTTTPKIVPGTEDVQRRAAAEEKASDDAEASGTGGK